MLTGLWFSGICTSSRHAVMPHDCCPDAAVFCISLRLCAALWVAAHCQTACLCTMLQSADETVDCPVDFLGRKTFPSA
jgi:hypothetical protein